MKFVILAIIASSALAFAPLASQRTSTALSMEVERRAAFGQIAAGVAFLGLPQLALADGAVSTATVTKARAVYGGRIYDLKSAVDSGNFDAIVAEKNAFVLFNSGAYPTAKDKSKKKAAIADTNAIFAAIRSGDKAALKSAYSSYVAANEIKPFPKADSKTQGFSSDFDYKRGTSAGTVYRR